MNPDTSGREHPVAYQGLIGGLVEIQSDDTAFGMLDDMVDSKTVREVPLNGLCEASCATKNLNAKSCTWRFSAFT